MVKKQSLFSRMQQSRVNWKQLEGGINEEKHKLLAEVYEQAQMLKNDDVAFDEMVEDYFSERRKRPKKEDALRLAFVYFLQAEGNARYDRACTYARALWPSYNQAVPADEIAEMIASAGGIEDMYRDVIEREKREGLGLQIEATSEELDEILGGVDVNEETNLVIKRLPNGKNGWIRFSIVEHNPNL